MSTIGGIGGASSARSGMHTERSAQMKDKLFAKVDADASGSVGRDELEQSMKSLMPPPSSTVEFAQHRGDDGDEGMSQKPPPGPAAQVAQVALAAAPTPTRWTPTRTASFQLRSVPPAK